jgi:hypothetical protein
VAFVALSAGACDAIIALPSATLSPELTCSNGACTCVAPHTYCSATFDGTCPINLDTDPLNCGRCGHSCLGGGCSSGACQPIILDGTTQPGGLSVSGSLLYLGICDPTQPTVAFDTLPIAGGQTATAVSSTTCGAIQTLFKGTLYWSNAVNGISSATLPAGTPTMLATAGAWVLSANTGYLFWGGLDMNGNDIGVFTMPVTGGTPTQLYTTPTNGSSANSLGGYWITAPDDTAPDAGAPPPTGIFFAPNGATAGTRLAPTPGDNIVVDDAHVFFSDGTGLQVFPVAGGKPTVLSPGATLAAGAVSGDEFFWLDESASTVNHVPIAGGPTTVLARNFAFEDLASIAVDAQAVYWVAGTLVAKVAR